MIVPFDAWRPDLPGLWTVSFHLEADDDVPENNLWRRGYHFHEFRDVAREFGVDDAGPGWAGAFADYDNDGCVDIFVVNHQDRPALLKNDCPTGNGWVKVRLQPTQSNRSGYGTIVEISTTTGTQRREIGSQPSYLSQDALEAHFGLGSTRNIEHIRVVFPSGVERLLESVEANQTLVVEE